MNINYALFSWFCFWYGFYLYFYNVNKTKQKQSIMKTVTNTTRSMEYFKSTSEIRAEVKNNYVYVRNLSEKGGVIDALLTDKTSKKVADCLQQITTESFSQVWDLLKTIKGVRLDYASN